MAEVCVGLWLLCSVAASDPAPADDVIVEADAPVVQTCGLPICGPLGARLYCIEEYESRHRWNAYNPRSGASGWLQWLSGTARQWGVAVGNRQSEWAGAARIAELGDRFFWSQWAADRPWCA